jgi:hypothetical protein
MDIGRGFFLACFIPAHRGAGYSQGRNKELFDQFKEIHDKYQEHPKQYQAQFNQVGEEIQKVIRKYENKLCGHTENSGFGKFSANLSTLFWEQIRALFPKIDDVGLL